MRRRTSVADRVRDVALVVGTVDINSIPASTEPQADHDASGTRLIRKVEGLPAPSHRRRQACEVHVFVLGLQLLRGSEGWVAHGHAEPGLEGRHFARGKVVDCLPPVRRGEAKFVAESVHAVEGSVARAMSWKRGINLLTHNKQGWVSYE